MNRRINPDRRLRDEIVKDEQRQQMRRNLEEFRREKRERRVKTEAVTQERRQKKRRTADIVVTMDGVILSGRR
jgi:hypothetical protein